MLPVIDVVAGVINLLPGSPCFSGSGISGHTGSQFFSPFVGDLHSSAQ